MSLVETHYVYLLQEREFIKSGEPIFKIGRTKQTGFKRFNNYSKGALLICHLLVEDSLRAENELIRVFSLHFNRKLDYGSEWFEGDIQLMRRIFASVAENHFPTSFPPKWKGDLMGDSADSPSTPNLLASSTNSSISNSTQDLLDLGDLLGDQPPSLPAFKLEKDKNHEISSPKFKVKSSSPEVIDLTDDEDDTPKKGLSYSPMPQQPPGLRTSEPVADLANQLGGLKLSDSTDQTQEATNLFFDQLQTGQLDQFPWDCFSWAKEDQKIWVCIELYTFYQAWQTRHGYQSKVKRNNFIKDQTSIEDKKVARYGDSNKTWYLVNQDLIHSSYRDRLPFFALGQQVIKEAKLEITQSKTDRLSLQQFCYYWITTHFQLDPDEMGYFIEQFCLILKLPGSETLNYELKDNGSPVWIRGLRDQPNRLKWSPALKRRNYWTQMGEVQVKAKVKKILDQPLPCCDQVIRDINCKRARLTVQQTDQIQKYLCSSYRPIFDWDEDVYGNYSGRTPNRLAKEINSQLTLDKQVQPGNLIDLLVHLGFPLIPIAGECSEGHQPSHFNFYLVPL